MKSSFRKMLSEEGYFCIRELDNGIVIALCRFIFTTGLCYNLSEHDYEYRYCYKQKADAIIDVIKWDGEGDPSGPWVAKK